MKIKLILSIFLLAGSLTISAQNRTSLGVKGGLNFASVTPSGSSVTYFAAGLFADVKLSKAVSFQPGLYYSAKGYKNESLSFAEKARINYLQVPLNFIYHIPVKPGRFFVGAGPYAAVALNGQVHNRWLAVIDDAYQGGGIYNNNTKITIGTNKHPLQDASYFNIKRMDYGLTGLAGFAFKNGLLFNVSYDLGLADIDYYPSSSLKTRTLGLSLGYQF